MLYQILLVLCGFGLLIKGADLLVKGSVALAKHYKVSELIIGLSIVGFGTSTPELVVNIISSVKGSDDVTLGNVVGSNLINLMLILGVSGLVYPLTIKISAVWKEIPFSLGASAILLFLSNSTFNKEGILSLNRIDGVILLLCFTIFIVYVLKSIESSGESLETDYKNHKPLFASLLIALGLVVLIFGSKLVVDNAVKLPILLGASEKLISVTIVAEGTSLPELVTTLVAAIRRKSDIAIGNIIGSNIFNIYLILGVCSIITPIQFNPSFNLEILSLILATLLLFIFMFSGKLYKLDRW